MKIIIGCLNSKYVHASLSPWCLLAGVREFAKGEYDATVMESTINAESKAFADKNNVNLITVNSWNEWTETSYLQPDNIYGYGYLQAIKKVFKEEQ